ncbi:MAG TPA: SelB C-terminal domain-containing protein, partial [Steroidobacteraceae bacterium]
TAVLSSTALRDAPVFALDATRPQDSGTDGLRQYLHDTAARLPRRPDNALFRLAVDRVFTLAGHGVIATGTVFAGRLRIGDTLGVMPAGHTARVRGIHAQNRGADSGHAGQRCAVNLAGIDKAALGRGDWLAAPGLLQPTLRVDVRLRLLTDAPRRLAAWTPVHVHMGTMHHVAHMVPLESDDLSAGDPARVQLVFDTPICALPGDRFVVRDSRAMHTIGGGVVLDPHAPSRRRRSAERMHRLDALEQWIHGRGLDPLLQQARHGLSMSELVGTTGLARERIALPAHAQVIDAGTERFVFDPARWAALRERTVSALREFHARAPDEAGADAGRLRRITAPDLPVALWQALVDGLVDEHVFERRGPWLHLPEHQVRLSAEDAALAGLLQPLIAAGRYDPPWVRDLAARLCEPEERVRQVLRKQVRQGAVCQVVHDLFYDSGRIAELAAIAARIAQEHGGIDAIRYRDALGLGRKRSIQILEYFDRVGYTRRVRDTHLLRVDNGWRITPS